MLWDAEALCDAEPEGCALLEGDRDGVVVTLGAGEGDDVGVVRVLGELDMLCTADTDGFALLEAVADDVASALGDALIDG